MRSNFILICKLYVLVVLRLVINFVEEKKEDYVFNYYKVKLIYGFLLFDFGDVIREGDG